MPQPTNGTLLAQYIAGSGETFDGSNVYDLIQWNDLSGNGYHLTQTGANGPRDELHGSSRVIWDVQRGVPILTQFDGTNGYMNIPSGLSIDRQNITMLFVGRRSNSALQLVNFAEMGGIFGTNGSDVFRSVTGKLQWFASAGNDPIATVPGSLITSSPIVFGYRGSNSESQFVWSSRIIPGSGTPSAGVYNSGATIGRGYNSSQQYNHSLYEAILLEDVSSSDLQEWVTWLNTKYAGVSTKTSNVVCVGDSTMAGEPWYTSSPTIAEKLTELFPSSNILSLAINSTFIATTGSTQVNSQISAGASMLNGDLATGEAIHPQPVRLALIMGGTNDINSGASAPALISGFASRVSEAKAFGATHVAICTIMDSVYHDASEDAVRATVNAEIKNLSGSIGHDIVINLHETANGGDDRLNDATANVGGLFQDGLHPSTAGRDVIVSIIQNNLQSVLANGIIGVNDPTPDDDLFLVGRDYDISWNGIGTSPNVDILFSSDGGSTYPITLESSYADSGVYSFTPTSAHVTATAKIKIQDSADDSIYGETNGFIIATTTPGSSGSDEEEWYPTTVNMFYRDLSSSFDYHGGTIGSAWVINKINRNTSSLTSATQSGNPVYGSLEKAWPVKLNLTYS